MSAFLHKVVKNSIWTGIGAAGSAVLNILFAGLTVRWLGVSDAGFVLAITALTAMTAGIAGLGFGAAGIRFLSEAQANEDHKAIRRIIGTLVTVSVSFGAIVLSVLLLAAPQLIAWTKYQGDPHMARAFCALVGLTVTMKQLSGCMITVLEAYQRFDFLTKRNLSFDLASGVLGIFVLRAYPTIITSGLITAGLAVINFVVLAQMAMKLTGFLPAPGWHRATFSGLWRLGRWSYLTSLGTMLLGQTDRVLITSMFGASVLPFYTMGKRGFEIGHQILAGQAGYLFPMLCAEGESKAALMERIEPKIRWFISVVSIWIYSVMILLGPAALDLIVGRSFGTHITLYIFIFSLVGILQAQSIVPWNFAYATDRVRLATFYQLFSIVGILPPMYLLGHYFGFSGAVWGQLGLITAVIFFYGAFWKDVKLSTLPWRILSPMLTPLFFYILAVVIWLYTKSGVGIVERLAIGILYSLLFFPIVVRIEKLLFPSSDAPATLRRAAERVTRKMPFPVPAMTMIFGKAA